MPVRAPPLVRALLPAPHARLPAPPGPAALALHTEPPGPVRSQPGPAALGRAAAAMSVGEGRYVRTGLSVNAVTGKGDKHGKMDDATARGMHPDEMALVRDPVKSSHGQNECGMAFDGRNACCIASNGLLGGSVPFLSSCRASTLAPSIAPSPGTLAPALAAALTPSSCVVLLSAHPRRRRRPGVSGPPRLSMCGPSTRVPPCADR